MRFRWRLMISIVPVVLALVGKLLVDLPNAKTLVAQPVFYNISIDLLLAAFGILLGALIIAFREPAIRKEVFWCSLAIFVALFVDLLLSVIVPALMGTPQGPLEVALSVILPDLVALVVFAFAVGVGT